MSVKLLTEHYLEFLSLKGGCTGSSESTLVKMPHCWKSHVTAQQGLPQNTNTGFSTTYALKPQNVFRILLYYFLCGIFVGFYHEFRILRLTFHRKSASKY